MKVRSFALDCRLGEAEEIVANIKDMGLCIEFESDGSYYRFIISDEELSIEQKREVYQYPPGGCDWSDCKWGDVQCKH